MRVDVDPEQGQFVVQRTAVAVAQVIDLVLQQLVEFHEPVLLADQLPRVRWRAAGSPRCC